MNWRRIAWFSGTLMILALVAVMATGYRSFRLYSTVSDVQAQVRYLIDSGATIGQTSADSALSSAYLEIIFGDDPELLNQLKAVVDRGMAAMPDVQQGEISSIIVTYRKNGDDRIENVVANIMGGFPLGRRNISMHRDGFFANQIDQNLWQTGDSALRFLGRDLAVWANNEDDERDQRELIEAIFAGEVLVVANSITDKPMYFTAVFPAPRQIVPAKMRNHVRAILLNGYLSAERGSMELVVLADNERSTALISSMMHDLKISILVGLRTRFRGVMEDTPWGPSIPVWWAYEMANTVEDMELVRRDRTVRLSTRFERRMVNATLKTIERFGRDYSQIRGVQEEKLDPRVVDARLRSTKPGHYWSDAHRWGPDWPIGVSTNILIRRPGDEERSFDSAPPVTR
ncbi:MAG TPA: hypothetical protein PJ991_08870 [Kiritimatiellia bacterium]|nr:hypothetical protein [Kiritimatiellia bacterium]